MNSRPVDYGGPARTWYWNRRARDEMEVIKGLDMKLLLAGAAGLLFLSLAWTHPGGAENGISETGSADAVIKQSVDGVGVGPETSPDNASFLRGRSGYATVHSSTAVCDAGTDTATGDGMAAERTVRSDAAQRFTITVTVRVSGSGTD